MLQRGAFTLSLDFEMLWGTANDAGPGRFSSACLTERQRIVDDLLRMLETFEISATWCVVGHLFLNACDGRHRDLASTKAHGADVFRHDPGGAERPDSMFLGRSLVEKILNCRVEQEVGCHSFAHQFWDEHDQAGAEADVEACLAASAWTGRSQVSFVFPRNRVAHLDVLASRGFRIFRGTGPRWYERRRSLTPLRRLAHLADFALGLGAPTVLPERTPSGLVCLPGSMIYLPSHGIRSLIPIERRVRRANLGLDRAVSKSQVFHLWFHPTNLAAHPEPMLEGLRRVFMKVARLRDSGKLEVRSMNSYGGDHSSRQVS